MHAMKAIMGIVVGFWCIGQGQQVLAGEGYISSIDAKTAIDTVKAYAGVSGPGENTFRIYDLVEDKEVLLGLKKLHTQDLRRLATNRLAVCAEYISQEGVDYMLWFDVQQGYMTQELINGYLEDVYYQDRMRVQDILIHVVGGKERIEWKQNDDEIWEVSTLPEVADVMHVHQNMLSKATENIKPVENAVCPECGSLIKSKKGADLGLKKHRCPSCKKKYEYDQYWNQHLSWPYESVHVCETCDTLVELCPVCLKLAK